MSLHDLVIVGSGLAGLTAAATVAGHGYDVRVFERLPSIGGLCGVFELDGHSFIRACNEFGGGVADVMRELRVEVVLERSSARVFLPEATVSMPFGARDIGQLLGHAPGLIRAIRAGAAGEGVDLIEGEDERARAGARPGLRNGLTLHQCMADPSSPRLGAGRWRNQTGFCMDVLG